MGEETELVVEGLVGTTDGKFRKIAEVCRTLLDSCFMTVVVCLTALMNPNPYLAEPWLARHVPEDVGFR